MSTPTLGAPEHVVATSGRTSVLRRERGSVRIADLQDYPAGHAHFCDICIVGSGPAGLTIATELANSRHDVIVLESGARSQEEPFALALNEIENVGTPWGTAGKVRNRVLGGSSHTWSGRCTWLDPIDFEARPWINGSGWPVAEEELTPFVERSTRYLGLVPNHREHALREAALLRQRLDMAEDAELCPVSWEFSQSSRFTSDYVRFGPTFARLSAENTRVLVHATVSNIVTSQDADHVTSLEVLTPAGDRQTIHGRHFVLCCGGVENARILLASNKLDPRGVGNRHDLVGRFLMDHPRATLGTFRQEDVAAAQQVLGLFRVPPDARFQCGFSLSPQVQRQEKLLNAAAWGTQHIAEDDAWRSLRSAFFDPSTNRAAKAADVFKNASQILGGIWDKCARGRPMRRRYARLDLDCMVEQEPDPTSRIQLSPRKDALGIPLAQIDWKIGEQERRSVIRLGKAVYQALAHAGQPVPILADWVRDDRPEDALFTDAAHPAGTTRMASSPLWGVVDPNCQVFGVDNLHIAGSSVFPTCGHANPTMAIVAFAIRLADRLRNIA